jgi:hypothetical protein
LNNLLSTPTPSKTYQQKEAPFVEKPISVEESKSIEDKQQGNYPPFMSIEFTKIKEKYRAKSALLLDLGDDDDFGLLSSMGGQGNA